MTRSRNPRGAVDGALVGGERARWRRTAFARRTVMQSAPVTQRVVTDVENEHSHPATVHAHDHYHVSHHHTGGIMGEFQHRTHYHQHEHNHAPLVHAHKGRSEEDEALDHEETAHTHDHDAPTDAGTG